MNSSNKTITDDRFETETLEKTVYKWLALPILEMFYKYEDV